MGSLACVTGETEEDRVERVVAERLIESHEAAAERFVWGAGAVFLLAIAAAAIRNEGHARRLAIATTLGTLLVLFLGYRTGETGGRLVYQYGAANAYSRPCARRPSDVNPNPEERIVVPADTSRTRPASCWSSHRRRSPWP